MALLPPRPRKGVFAGNFNAERAALILVDALILGDEGARQKWQVSAGTLKNYRDRVDSDPNFAELYARTRAAVEGDWKVVRLEFLRAGIAKLKELVAKADSPKHIRDVSEAVKTVGELQIVSDALNVGDRTDLEDEESSANPGDSSASSPASPTLQ
jgi:hypothetical protein